MRNLKPLFLTPFCAFVALSACSLKSGHDGDLSLYLDLSALENGAHRFSLLGSSGGFLGLVASPPASASAFACYAVNVTGPGIADTGHGSNSNAMAEFYRTLNEPDRYCSYRGVVTPPLYLDGSGRTQAALQVPPGNLRLVQIVGVNDAAVCSSGVVDDPPGSAGGDGRFYEIGRSVLHDVFSDAAVDVATNWPAAAADQLKRQMDCGDGNCATDDHYDPAAAQSGTLGVSSNSKYGQMLVTAPGKRVREITLNLSLLAAADVTATLWEGSSSYPTVATGFSRMLSLPALAGVNSYAFDMRDGNGNALVMQSGTIYWIVLTATGGGSAVAWQYKYVGSGGAGSATYGPSVWSVKTDSLGFDYRIRQCDQ